MDNSLDTLIRVYDNHIPPAFCDEIVRRFEGAGDHHVSAPFPPHRVFTEMNLMATPGWDDVTAKLIGAMQDGVRRYVDDAGVSRVVWPEKNGYEQIRMKRYLPNGEDQFDWHVDVQDHASARRFLVYFWYLTDVAEGGETEFQWGRSVRPQKGRLIMFPPTWEFPHRGAPVVDGVKYIVGGYLHYL